MTSNQNKIAIVSHVLPPDQSGQATVLYHLLEDVPSESYCLISAKEYNVCNTEITGTTQLPANYFTVKNVRGLRGAGLIPLIGLVNAFVFTAYRALQIMRIVKQNQCNVIVACTGDLYDLPAAFLASKLLKVPLVCYIFDDYIQQWTGWQRTFATIVGPLVIRNSTVIVPNEYMQKEYIERYNVTGLVIHNLCVLHDVKDLDAATEQIFNTEEINIVYTGSIYHAHYDAFRNLIEAIELVGRHDIKLHLYTAQPEAQLAAQGIKGEQVIYHAQVSHADVQVVLHQADMLFLPLAFQSPIPEVIRTSAPGKMGEYLAASKPILVHAPQDSFVTWYFRENKCGLVVDSEDPALLAEAIRKIISDKSLAQNISNNARQRAELDYDAKTRQQMFKQVLLAVLKGEA